MDYWWVGLLVLALLPVVLVLLPVHLGLSLHARAEPNGAYAVAGGAQLGPLAVTFVFAQGVPFRLEFRVLGKVITRSERSLEAAEPSHEPPERSHAAREPRISPFDWLEFLLRERRRINLRWADVHLEYSFRNVALTGQWIAALCTLSAFLPRRVRFVQSPSWELVDRVSLAVDSRLRLWPGLLLLDSLRFWVRSTMLPGRARAKLEPA